MSPGTFIMLWIIMVCSFCSMMNGCDAAKQTMHIQACKQGEAK